MMVEHEILRPGSQCHLPSHRLSWGWTVSAPQRLASTPVPVLRAQNIAEHNAAWAAEHPMLVGPWAWSDALRPPDSVSVDCAAGAPGAVRSVAGLGSAGLPEEGNPAYKALKETWEWAGQYKGPGAAV